jgi:hypothetical protein
MQTEKLTELATHLETGLLGHAVFDNGNHNVGPFVGYPLNRQNTDNKDLCRYAGDALGEMPFISMEWSFDPDTEQPVYEGLEQEFRSRPTRQLGADWAPIRSAILYFKLTEEQAWHLFMPGRQDPGKFGGEVLTSHATRYQVAHHIRLFIEKMEKHVQSKKGEAPRGADQAARGKKRAA